MTLSKNKIKFIRSLELKKNRREEKAFVAEGHKLVGDLLSHFELRTVVATREWIETNNQKLVFPGSSFPPPEIIEASAEDLSKVSLLKNPQDVVAVFAQRDDSREVADCLDEDSLQLALDDIQDPGNLGTIVRIADWFGIRDIFCSFGTADIYNPKTVQATMGAMARVRVHYCQLTDLLTSSLDRKPVYGTFLDGDDIYSADLTTAGLIVVGNEGKGISQDVAELVSRRLLIPSFPKGEPTSESLNVAVATAVVCSEFRRRAL